MTPMMDSVPVEDILKTIHNAVVNKKGDNPLLLDVRELTSICDYFYIVSGWSERQVQAISHDILDSLREIHIRPLHVEGEENSKWILADYGSIVIHIFLHDKRAYYDLEHLWADAPRVDMAAWITPLSDMPPGPIFPHRVK